MTNNQQLGVGNLFPYLDDGLNSAALQFTNSAEGSGALAGDLSATANGADFQFYSSNGAQVANANGGLDVGGSDLSHINNVFYVSSRLYSPATASEQGFCYTTGTTANPNGTVNYVTIGGQPLQSALPGHVELRGLFRLRGPIGDDQRGVRAGHLCRTDDLLDV